MGIAMVEQARENAEFSLRSAIEQLSETPPDPYGYFGAGFAHRVLGICALLERADVTTFATHLARAGQAWADFLERVANGWAVPVELRRTSKDVFVTAALAAGDLATAKQIAARATAHHLEGEEYEDDFLFVHFLHQAVLGAPEATLTALVTRWEQILEGGESAQLECCRGLLDGAPEGAFAAAFGALCNERRAELAAYAKQVSANPELVATEGKLFIEGLALLRVAELRGKKAAGEFPLIPAIARVPVGIIPPLPARAWMAPLAP